MDAATPPGSGNSPHGSTATVGATPWVGDSDCQDLNLDKAVNEVVSKQLAQIVTNSYGDRGEDIPAGLITAFQHIAIHATRGIGLYFSSGDSGHEAANLNGVRTAGVARRWLFVFAGPYPTRPPPKAAPPPPGHHGALRPPRPLRRPVRAKAVLPSQDHGNRHFARCAAPP